MERLQQEGAKKKKVSQCAAERSSVMICQEFKGNCDKCSWLLLREAAATRPAAATSRLERQVGVAGISGGLQGRWVGLISGAAGRFPGLLALLPTFLSFSEPQISGRKQMI